MPMRYASAKGLTMKASCNKNLPTQTNDVMVNPVNPDSKRQITGTIWKLTFHSLKNLLFPEYPDSKSLMLYTPPISFTLRSPIQFLVLKGTDSFQRFKLVVEIRYGVIPTFITGL